MPHANSRNHVALLSACLALATAGPASAAPLAPEACEAAKIEHKTLVDSGIPDVVKKGPSWAKANVSTAKLKDVERYIGLQEQLLFRCGLAKLRDLPVVEDEPADPPATPQATNDGEPSAAAPAPKAKAKPKPQPPGARPQTKPAAKAAEAPPPAEPAQKPPSRPKPKPKADDAYRPPAKPETSQD